MISVMQGRLLPPENGKFQSSPSQWWRELPLAEQAGLDGIEWIFESLDQNNPLVSCPSVLKYLSEKTGIRIHSCCADFFMKYLLIDQPSQLKWLLDQCYLAGIKRVILPFVDGSSLKGKNLADSIIPFILNLEHSVEIHLETDLPPIEFKALLDRLPNAKVCYDSGNSTANGYDIREEFGSYGERIGSVHVKDRIKGGGTVPIGMGDVDFQFLFDGLRFLEYKGDFTLQVARGEAGTEVETVRAQVEWLRGQI